MSDYIKRVPKGNRRTFWNVTNTGQENLKIDNFHIYLHKQSVRLPGWWGREFTLKILYTANFDFHQALALVHKKPSGGGQVPQLLATLHLLDRH